MTTAGVVQLGTLNLYICQEVETIAFSVNLKTKTYSEGGLDVIGIKARSYIKVKGVAFGTARAKSLSVRIARTGSSSIAVRLRSQSGVLIRTYNVASTRGTQTWKTVDCAISSATRTKNLFFVFGRSGYSFNYQQFTQKQLENEVIVR